MAELIRIADGQYIDPLTVTAVVAVPAHDSVLGQGKTIPARVRLEYGNGETVVVNTDDTQDAEQLAAELTQKINDAKRLRDRFDWESLRAKEAENRVRARATE